MVDSMTKHDGPSLILHLGDAADTPCTGEYDEFDDYNAGMKWRIFAPEKNSTEKKSPKSEVSARRPADANLEANREAAR